MFTDDVPILLRIKCDTCGAKPGKPCSGMKAFVHDRRMEAAQPLFEAERNRIRAKLDEAEGAT